MRRPATIAAALVIAALTACTVTPEVPSPTQALSQPSSSQPSSGQPSAPPTPTATPQPSPTPSSTAAVQHRIGVREVDGAGEFFDRYTGAAFTPRGNNLIRLDSYHDTFNPARTTAPISIGS